MNPGHSQDFEGPFDGNAFDGTCAVDYPEGDCYESGGNDLGNGLLWAGGTWYHPASTHMGLVKNQDIHVVCNDGVEADDKWGHFHRNGVNTGVYVFGDTCINEVEWAERFYLYALLPGEFNADYSPGRVTVEWGFRKVVALYPYVDYSLKLKLLRQNVGLLLPMAVFLTNCHTCICGDAISDATGMEPPELEDWLAGSV